MILIKLYFPSILRKATAILFALIVVSGLTEFHQALKLPVLLSHYQYHKTTNRSLSLLEFLKLHYFTNQHPDDND
ncbi:MAG: hypothetical protein KDB99_12805, partial [Chitinophagaceae bacterium]|nr:hypothetical protein [Chitinophagaceae bacterium]